MKKITLIAAAIAALGVSAQASAAFTATPIVFDMNGAAAGGVINVTSFDWTPGNALAVDAIGSTTGQFNTYFQASLGSFQYNDEDPVTPLSGSQFTVQAVIKEQVVGVGLGGAQANFISLGGSYKIFYDTNPLTRADSLSGDGYGDGLLILEGTINFGGTGSFANNTIGGTAGITNLDTFGTNNRPGIYSHSGNGSSTVTVDVTYANSNFFKSNISSLAVDLNDTSNLAAPFAQTNPSEQVVGQTPNYGVGVVGGVQVPINGAGCGDVTAGTTCDFHFQSDSTTSFQATVPEPGSLAIAGAGLALMSLVRRRKAK